MNSILICIKNVNLYYIILFSSEILTIIIETLLIYLIGKEKILRSFIFVLLANFASYTVGMLLNLFALDAIIKIILSIIFMIFISLFLALRLSFFMDKYK